jgi:hypothetical protein
MGLFWSRAKVDSASFTTMEEPRTPAKKKKQWRERLGVNSPPKDPDRDSDSPLTVEDVEAMMRQDECPEMTKYLLEHTHDGEDQRVTNERAIIYFLYGRGFDKNSNRDDRVKRILEFIKDKRTKDRMLCIISVRPDETSAKMEYWRYCQMAVIRYGQLHGAMTIFGDGMPCNGMPCRLQISGISFLRHLVMLECSCTVVTQMNSFIAE